MKPYVVVVVGDDDSHILRVLAHALTVHEPLCLSEHRPSRVLESASAIFSNFSLADFLSDWPAKWAEIRDGFEAFLTKLAPVNLHPNPLTILARALNARLPMRSSFVPRWRRGRWKAKS